MRAGKTGKMSGFYWDVTSLLRTVKGKTIAMEC